MWTAHLKEELQVMHTESSESQSLPQEEENPDIKDEGKKQE